MKFSSRTQTRRIEEDNQGSAALTGATVYRITVTYKRKGRLKNCPIFCSSDSASMFTTVGSCKSQKGGRRASVHIPNRTGSIGGYKGDRSPDPN